MRSVISRIRVLESHYKVYYDRWNSLNITTPEQFDTILSKFRVQFAYNSNKIEEISITLALTRDIFSNSEIDHSSNNLRNIFTTQNQKACYEFLRNSYFSKIPISIDFIKKVHNITVHGCYSEELWSRGDRPGEFKTVNTIINTLNGEYPTMDSNNVKQALMDLLSYINGQHLQTLYDILISAAQLYFKYESIHPFADGNGRTGRSLLLYFMLLNKCPPFVIFEDNNVEYYTLLRNMGYNGDFLSFAEFLVESTAYAWESYILPVLEDLRLKEISL